VKNPQPDQIVIMDLQPSTQHGVQAVLTVRVHGVVVRNCQIRQRDRQLPFLVPPQNVVEFSGTLHDEVEVVAVKAWLDATPDKRLIMVPKPGPEGGQDTDRQPTAATRAALMQTARELDRAFVRNVEEFE
jgi:hypothetical protein